MNIRTYIYTAYILYIVLECFVFIPSTFYNVMILHIYVLYIFYSILNLNICVSAGHERLPSVALKWLRFKNIPNPH